MREKIGLLFLKYIRFFAKLQLAKIKPDIIGITGSAGKSSTRNAVEIILKQKYKCKTTGKANSESGIPLDILDLEMHSYSIFDWLRVSILAPIKLLTNWEQYDKYIVEMGVDSPDEPKNMRYLLTILQPKIGVFVNAAAVHSQPFDKLILAKDPAERKEQAIRLIAKEKGRMIESLSADGFAILNFDDENVREFAEKTKASVWAVTGKGQIYLSPTSTIQFSNLKYDVNGFACDFEYKYEGQVLKQHLEFNNQIFGPHYGITFGLAIAVGLASGVAFNDCVDALRLYKLPPGRMSLLRGIKDSRIIDSSYNASAEPMIAALDVLEKSVEDSRKISVLGDMRELGEEAQYEHERIAEKAVQVSDEIVLVGPLMKEFFIPKAEELGFDKDKIHWFENSAQAAPFVRDLIEGGEVILVKGSQNTIFLERVVEAIMEDPSQADELLCRRGAYWDKIREKYI